jgi:20S proteasome alpha/beta subunit
MTKDQAISLGVKALKEGEKKLAARNVDICLVENGRYRKLDANEVKKLF